MPRATLARQLQAWGGPLLARLVEAQGIWAWDHAQTGDDDAHIAQSAAS